MKKRTLSILLTVAVLLTCFAYTAPVNAASKADMKKANVKWDLKNNKTLKYKQYWSGMGAKTHTVKMTKFKIKNAKKKGYKECTFTLTYNMKINPTKKQVFMLADTLLDKECYTDWYCAVVDYKTGKSLGAKNNQGVTVTYGKWKYSSYSKKIKGDYGSWIKYPRKASVNVKIVYPKNYKNLAIGVGGCSSLKSHSKFWNGKISFSKATMLYSKKDKNFAHFMRIK